MRGGLAAEPVRFEVVAAGSSVSARVRTTLHDLTIDFADLRGTVTLEGGELSSGASGTIEVGMASARSGDPLSQAKVHADLAPGRWPLARFRVTGVDAAQRAVHGELSWRDRNVALTAVAHVVVAAESLTATASFTLDMRDFGLTPPRFLLLKSDPLVALTVRLTARAAPAAPPG